MECSKITDNVIKTTHERGTISYGEFGDIYECRDKS